ncbi:MAG: DUF1553 domain-containing protein [Fuerstiella sp.]|nr:DUF1553 domain-containing protein [Fuerstiella sp.]
MSAKKQAAYVTELLSSHHYAERMTGSWLDLVRYADTNGIHGDNHRDVWMYRDYVIDAFHRNMPFDQFTTEQLAGDLLPNATDEQRIASGYNRLLMTTREGGAQPKEYLAKYSADRVRNASTVWLGATMSCCECHEHKFDPYSLSDFYHFAAFFADIQDVAVGVQPQVQMPSRQQKEARVNLDAQITELQNRVMTQTPEIEAAMQAWALNLQAGLKDNAFGLATQHVAILEAWPDVSDEQKTAMAVYYRSIAPLLADARGQLIQAKKAREPLEKQIPEPLSARTQTPREIRILARGNWMDDSGLVASPQVPHFLEQLSVERRATRLDLAQWLVDRENPLVARVFVNRLWQQFFGKGIVRTADDFGSQGSWPTHPELLDWLAVEFRESGWNIQHVIRLIVSSDAYRRTSAVTPELRETDPFNDWLAYQSRYRLDAEFIRDNALAVSGLLVDKVGGRSAKPYQPAGYWAHLNFPTRKWQHDHGDNQYRRGLYTYWCRTFLHPAMRSFDAPTREECTVERPRSNNSLQALVLLNDPSFVEAARTLAAMTISEGGPSTETRLQFVFRRCLSRDANAEETDVLKALLEKQQQQFAAAPKQAHQLISVGQSAAPSNITPAELAAWTAVARVVLNLHEVITRT